MSRPILAPLVVALSALLVAPQIQAEPTAPLFVVEQQRSALVTRLAKQWSDDFAVLPATGDSPMSNCRVRCFRSEPTGCLLSP